MFLREPKVSHVTHLLKNKISWNDPVLAKDFYFYFSVLSLCIFFFWEKMNQKELSLCFSFYYIFDSVLPSLRWLDNHKYAAVGKVVKHSEEHLVLNEIWLKKFLSCTTWTGKCGL